MFCFFDFCCIFVSENLKLKNMNIRLCAILMGLTLTFTAKAQEQKSDTLDSFLRIGYSLGNINTLAGAIDKVTEKQMNKGLVISSLDALNGQSAGVQITNRGDQEAMVSAVRVRGTTSLTGGNDPLVIIDGVASDLRALITIYPADIESFTILKDATETAQYGSRGAAGVIEVSTKKSRSGRFQIAYDGNIGFESIFKQMQMLSGDEFRQAAQQMNVDIVDGGQSTNYRDAIARTGYVQNHHIAFGGGNDASSYRTSIGVVDHQTVIKTYRLKNYIAKLDVNQKAFDDHLTVDLGVFASIQKNNLLPFKRKLFYSADTFNPTLHDGRNAEGSFDNMVEALWISNPVAMLEMKDDEESGHINAHIRAKADLGYGIQLTAFGSYSYTSADNAHYYPTFIWSKGEAYRADVKSEQLLGNITLEKTVNITSKQHVSLLALAEMQSSEEKGFNVTTSNFVTDAFGYNNISAGAVSSWEGIDSYYTDSHMQSFMLRAKYTLLDRYSLMVNARADGSSKVGRNHRWGFFPSLSGVWIVSDEPWMKSLKWLSTLKLRAGMGRSGNLGGISSYNSMQLIQPNGVVNVGGTIATTLGIIRNANPDLKWEVKRAMNLGFNIGFWDKRVMLTADFYKSKTSDLLYMYDVPVPPYPYNKLLANLGEMENKGMEIGFGITPLSTRDIDLSINLNMAFQSNKLISLNGEYNGSYLTAPDKSAIANLSGAGFHGGSDITMQIVGEELGVFYLHHCNGLVKQDDGSYKYDVTDEKYVCGQAVPKMTLGSNIALRYRQWDINIQMNGAFGHKIYNGTALTYMNMKMLPNYNVMKGAPEQNIQDQTISDYWLERGDYLNFDYMAVGWNVPLKSKFVQQLRLSASVNNLATITSYSGLTPMINSSVIDSTLGVDDKCSFPVYRSYSFGLSVKF